MAKLAALAKATKFGSLPSNLWGDAITVPAHSLETRRASSVVALDLLRGLAAITVLLVHVRGSSFVEYGALPEHSKTVFVAILFGLTRLGQEAVLVFFVLSGFLVGGSLIDRARLGTFDHSKYAIDRCTRILLPLVPACLLTAAIGLIVFNENLGVWRVAANMIGLNGVLAQTLDRNLPLWSLTYEIWFYIVGGALACIATKRALIISIFALGTSMMVFSFLGAAFLLYWAFGALMFFFIDRQRNGWLFVAGIAFILVGATALEMSFPSQSFVNYSYIPNEVSRAMLCIGASLLLPYLCGKTIDRLLSPLRRAAGVIAAGSYTLYLVHYPVLCALDTIFPKFAVFDWESLTFCLARIVICLVVSILFYFCFERNTVLLRRWLERRTLARAGA